MSAPNAFLGALDEASLIAYLGGHVIGLAFDQELEIDYTEDPRHLAFWRDDQGAYGVTIAPIRTLGAYACALHELGHSSTYDADEPLLIQEQRAWAWAREHSAIPFTPEMTEVEQLALRTHVQGEIKRVHL